MKSLIRSLLAIIYGLGALSYSGRERVWYARGYRYPVSTATLYHLVRRVYGEFAFVSRYYIMNRQGRVQLSQKGRLARQRRIPQYKMGAMDWWTGPWIWDSGSIHDSYGTPPPNITREQMKAWTTVGSYDGDGSPFYLAGPYI